ncbi:MAG: hypothetical protein HY671_06215 [Chloroflexi bacterium]|nr:hypothetical protein [Chloroflexota bacterium]
MKASIEDSDENYLGCRAMSGADILWLALRWLHAIAAAGWVGSALFYAAVVGPGMGRETPSAGQAPSSDRGWTLGQSAAGEWREFQEIAAFVLIISGALLSVNRLTQPNIGAAYAIVLGVKVALAVLMALLALRAVTGVKRGAASAGGLVSSSWFTGGLGAVIVLLAIILRMLYERTLAA